MALINCPECNKQISDKAEICVGCGAPVKKNDESIIIIIPIKFGNLEVAQEDIIFPNSMTWNEANEVCVRLGNGWRLPNKDELNTLYQNKDTIDGFLYFYYWSSTENDVDNAWAQYFYTGFQKHYDKNTKYNVRVVRSL